MGRLQRLGAVLVSLLLALLAVGLVACGGDDEDGRSTGSKTEQAFLQAMAAHHMSALDMAELAKQRGRHNQIRRLAGDILTTQTHEIEQMQLIHERLFGSELIPDSKAHEPLGLSADEAGMHPGMAAKLKRAKPFDRAFIDEMVPHHRGAIRMARIVQAESEDARLKRLAREIIAAQSREIEDMSGWRKRWYGS